MSKNRSYVLDLAAERREVQYPHGIVVKFADGLDLMFPAELPADALDPLLSEELDIVGILGEVLLNSKGGDAMTDAIEVLFRRPRLPRLFLAAVKDTYRVLLGDEAFERFTAARPSIADYVRLTKGLATVYGVDLGKLFGSVESSETTGPTSKQTSPASTDSTPEASGAAPASADSSESAD